MKKHLYLLAIFLLAWGATPLLLQAEPTNASPLETLESKTAQKTQPPPHHTLFDNEKPADSDLKDEDRFLSEFLNMLATLGLVIIIILIVTWGLKRMLNKRIEQMNDKSRIKIVRRSLSPRSTLYILDIYGKGVVVGESQNGLTGLGTIDIKAASSTENKNQGFAAVLEKITQPPQKES